MGFFSRLFSPKPKEETDSQAKALRRYFDEKLPKNYVNSKKYAVAITREGGGYAAKITLDMRTDGSDYSTFGQDDYMGLAEMESSYLFSTFLTDPPVSVNVQFEMVFDSRRCITVDTGRTPAG